MPAISVIMPVYNSEKYLANAINSVLNQTFKDFELILVDDGSSDSSPAICDEYAKKDNRIIVCHKENGGICDARNKGLELAKGEYIGFIDNDDEYDPNLLNDNYNLAAKYNADIVKYGYRRLKQRNEQILEDVKIHSDKLLVLQKSDLTSFYPIAKKLEITNLMWNGLYARRFISENNLTFNPQYRFGYEDYEFNMLLYPHIQTLVINPETYYIWKQRMGNSTSTKFDVSKLDSIIRVMRLEQNLLRKLQISADYYNQRMTAGLCTYIGYLLHPMSDLDAKSKINYVESFYAAFGKLQDSAYIPLRQKIYISLYNSKKYRLLLDFKWMVNQVRRLKYGYYNV